MTIGAPPERPEEIAEPGERAEYHRSPRLSRRAASIAAPSCCRRDTMGDSCVYGSPKT
jgi:hypothetical protein